MPAAEFNATVILCYVKGANVREITDVTLNADPFPGIRDHFAERVALANAAGVGDISRAYELEAGKTHFIEVVTAFGTAGTMRMISNQEGEQAIKDLPDSSIATSRQ